MFFKQIHTGTMGNFTYIFGCKDTRMSAVVDPPSDITKVINILKDNNFKLEYIYATHTHFDHIGGIRELKAQTNAKTVVHRLESNVLKNKNIPVDIEVEEGDHMRLGTVIVRIIHTPGHTPGGICLLINNEKLITGDTLFVGDCGRTDLSGGNSKQLYESLEKKIKTLPDNIEVYPGHDYGGESSTIEKEKKSNPALNCKTLAEFEALP
ncbi:MAG: MBL fold metallo-hydrolase [Candidatus Schekmanbacteria bacterium]|nr:MAG: MBL fold metallo-hydrolase [Candidatus Schekmanbacteria bacterium]